MSAPEPDVSAHSSRRDRSIRLAVATSFLSKAGTALFQLISIPLAVRVLGREEFGLYTTVNFTLATVSLLQVGIGPALAHGLSEAKANDDDRKARSLGSTAFFLTAGLASVAGLLLSLVLLMVPLPQLFGADFAGREDALRPALWTGLALFLLLFVLNLTDRMREGLLETATNNIWGAAGNVIAALAVGVGIFFVPEVWFLVLAVHGSLVVAKLANTVTLWRSHPELIPRAAHANRGMAAGLFTDGLAFSACTLVTGIVEYNFCGWLVGRAGGPDAVALYGVFVTLTILQLGFVMMLSTPTWPAVAEALARGDREWARKAATRLSKYAVAFAFCSATGLIAFGPWVFHLWLGDAFAGTPRTTLACYSLYFVAHVWRHVQHTLMIGTGQVKRLARIQFAESALIAGGAWLALDRGGVGGLLLMMAAIVLLVTGSWLPRLVKSRLSGTR